MNRNSASRAYRRSLRIGLGLCVSLAGVARADDFEVVLPGLTVTNGDAANVLDGDDFLVVQGTGSIIVNGVGDNATEANGDRNLIRNLGTLDASGIGADGIRMVGADNVAQNGQLIQATGDFGRGISVQGPGGVIVNSGDVQTTGDIGTGLLSVGDGAAVVNSDTGSVVTAGDDSQGITSQGLGALLLNAGAVETFGIDSGGLLLNGEDGRLFNLGDVTTAGEDAHGIAINGIGNTVEHTGSITTTGLGADGIRITDDDHVLTISEMATISIGGANSDGIFIDGDQVTLRFEDGFIFSDGIAASGIRSAPGSNDITIFMGQDASISTVNTGGRGILVSGDGIRVEALGTIVTSGDGGTGIGTGGPNATVIHSGSIRTTGGGADGLELGNGGSNSTLLNSGQVRTEGDNAQGIRVLNGGHSVTNSGLIRVSGANSIGIEVETAGATGNSVVNTGLIDVVGAALTGIDIRSDASEVLNLGDIRSGPGAAGILSFGDDVFVRNSGRIFAGGDAFNAAAADAVLRLDAGSIIVGGIAFGDVASATIDVGLPNAALTLTGVPSTILADGRPHVVIGNVLHVADPDHVTAIGASAFAAWDAIGFALEQARRTGPGEGGPSLIAAGALGSREDSDDATGILGGSIALGSDRTIGFFVGRQSAPYETAFSASRLDTTSSYAVLSWGGATAWGFFEAAGAIGVGDTQATRRIANNLVPSGIEIASADVGTRFAGVSALVGTDVTVAERTLRPSMRLRYVWQDMDGISETGSGSNLALGARTAQRLEVRARMDTEVLARQTPLGEIAISGHAGFDVVLDRSDDAAGTLDGAPFTFDSPGAGLSMGSFLGANATIELGSRSALVVSGEMLADRHGRNLRVGALYRLRF